MVFGIQMYHEGMQVKFKYGCGPIIIGGSWEHPPPRGDNGKRVSASQF
jgi:hypothetical protein